MSQYICALLGLAMLLLGRGALAAGEGHDISFDAHTDFRAFKTFAIRDGQITSNKPEIDNRLFRQRMQDTIRAALVAHGVKESADQPELSVTYQIVDADVATVERRQPTRVPDLPGDRGFVIPGGPQPLLFTEGTLVIDLLDSSGTLLWRGTWHERESSGPKLSLKLSDDARRLLQDFPPRHK